MTRSLRSARRARRGSPRRAAWTALRVLAVADRIIGPNTYVTVDYELRDEDGDMLEASAEEGGAPIRYVHGYGMLVPGLEAALAGLREGDQREVVVPADAGYGEYDESLLLEVGRDELPDPTGVKVGDEFIAESPDGDEIAMSVVEIHDKQVVVDANHPLAGMTLRYQVRVLGVREATADEIEHAAAQLDEAHEHVHGPDCDHDHDHDAPVQLGKSKQLN
jgi:FKBP-type peptidyl-prolyl cis-trans isomerase SlyD